MRRQQNMVEVFEDISYASEGQDKSVQGIIGFVRFVDGAPVCWETSPNPSVSSSLGLGGALRGCWSTCRERSWSRTA